MATKKKETTDSKTLSTSSGSDIQEMAALMGMTVEEYLDYVKVTSDIQQENVGVNELQISRMSIAQPGTPNVAQGVEGWKTGMLFDSLTDEIISTYAKPPWLLEKGIEERPCNFVAVIPIFKLPTEYVRWPSKEERDEGQKSFHWKTLDRNDPRVHEGMWPPIGRWKGEGSPPVTEHLNVLLMPVNHETAEPIGDVLVGSFSRTSYRAGRLFVNACLKQKSSQGLPFFGRLYYLYTNVKTEDGNTFAVIDWAKGPSITEFAKRSDEIRLNIAERMKVVRELVNGFSDEDTGRTLQELYINSASFGTIEPHTDTVQEGATEDPNF